MNDVLDVLIFRARQVYRAMWFLPAVLSIVAVVTVWASYVAAQFAPDELPFTVQADGVRSMLTILGSSMLTVAVFSLSTVVSTVARASESTTPRAVPLILQDRVAQTAISIFVGAFLFSIVGVIGLSSGIYSDAGRLVLFFVTLAVIVAVVAALIRWIGRLSTIGRVDETIALVERAATHALRSLSHDPLYGCQRRDGPPAGVAIASDRLGYVQQFDVPRLAQLAETTGTRFHIVARPGDFVGPDTPIVFVDGDCPDDLAAGIRGTFTLGLRRTFEFDPGFGLIVLGEIASRALSPAVNDSGTAVAVASALARVFADAPDGVAGGAEAPEHELLTIAPVEEAGLIEAAFRPIARDGAGRLEVVAALVSALGVLERMPRYADPARQMSAQVRDRARAAMTFGPDREAVGRL